MSVVIGVTGPDEGGRAAWWATRLAIARTGASAARLTSLAHGRQIDALIIGGGSHVDPSLYRQERQPDYAHYDEARDRFEMRLLEQAQQDGKPVLAICRGMQLLNVSRGGSLNQDAWANVPGDTRNSLRARFDATVNTDSLLHEVMQREKIAVNRLHRQSIDDLGAGLRASARGQGGIVQAIEPQIRDSFLVGVQWHPEYLPHHPRHQRLFFELTQAARHSHA